MRGISKSLPPRNVYPDGQRPASLREAEDAYLADLPETGGRTSFARSEFDLLDKRKLRIVMYREQRSLCVYCERSIGEGYPLPRIDHWRPLGGEPGLALHWDNLYLSCPTAETCDSAKRDRALRWDDTDPHIPWPVDLRYEDVVGFTSRGEIYVRTDVSLPDATRRGLELAIGDCPDGTRVRRGIVNLNHPALVAARAAEIDVERARMERALETGIATRNERDERAAGLLDRDRRPAFVSIRVAWLRRRLGEGR